MPDSDLRLSDPGPRFRDLTRSCFLLLVGLLCGCEQALFTAVPGATAVPVVGQVDDTYRSPTKQVSSVTPILHSYTSCSTSNCHGSPVAAGSGTARCDRNEAIVWRQWDPHRNAAATLESARAAEMLAKLSPDRVQSPTQDLNCLSCHAPQLIHGDKLSPLVPALQALPRNTECVMCHGSDPGWIYEHVTWSEQELSASYQADSGMTPLSHPVDRVRVCVECHVGGSNPVDPKNGQKWRNVDHDLIAAGHPRLDFDFVAFSQAIRPHWNHPDPLQNPAVEHWVIGNWYGMKARLELLASRVGTSDRRLLNTELAEFNCFACHQVLAGTPESRAKNRHYGSKWENPYQYFFAEMILEILEPTVSGTISEDCQKLVESMEKLRTRFSLQSSPEQSQIARECAAILSLMNSIEASGAIRNLALQPVSPEARSRLLVAIEREIKPDLAADGIPWRKAVSVALLFRLLLPAENDDAARESSSLRNQIEELIERLDFASEKPSQRLPQSYILNGPDSAYTNDQVAEQISEILQQFIHINSNNRP